VEVAAIEQGFQQREIAEASYKYQAQTESGEKVIVGVNKYTMDDSVKPEILRIGAEVEEQQLERLHKLREERDGELVEQTLKALRDAAVNGENLMPHMLDAVRAYATVGEVCGALIPVFGTYREVSVI